MKKILALALAVPMIAACTLSFASCGKKDELNFGKEFRALTAQVDVLFQLKNKSIDVGVMDSVMAGYYMSQDTTYSEALMIVDGLVLATEQYGIGCRKGSGLAKMIDWAMIELAKDGTVDTIADKYGVKSEICIDKTATVADLTDAEKVDWEYVKGQGKFLLGYTLFAPIAYKDADGKLIGFDIELANAVAAKLELTMEPVEIEWSAKEAKLESKAIDVIWNGMTITEQRAAQMELTIPYMNNKQVAVIRKDDKDLYKTTDDMAKAIIGAEDGSAGMDCVIKSDAE